MANSFYDEQGVFHASCGCTLQFEDGESLLNWNDCRMQRDIGPGGQHAVHVRTECILHERALREQQPAAKVPSDAEIETAYDAWKRKQMFSKGFADHSDAWQACARWVRDQMRGGAASQPADWIANEPLTPDDIAYGRELAEKRGLLEQQPAAGYELGEPVRFDACPPGLFAHNDDLCVKAQGTTRGAMICRTGEDRFNVPNDLMVRPVRGPLPLREPALVLDCEAEYRAWASTHTWSTGRDTWDACFARMVKLGVIRARVPEPVDPCRAAFEALYPDEDEARFPDNFEFNLKRFRSGWDARGEAKP